MWLRLSFVSGRSISFSIRLVIKEKLRRIFFSWGMWRIVRIFSLKILE